MGFVLARQQVGIRWARAHRRWVCPFPSPSLVRYPSLVGGNRDPGARYGDRPKPTRRRSDCNANRLRSRHQARSTDKKGRPGRPRSWLAFAHQAERVPCLGEQIAEVIEYGRLANPVRAVSGRSRSPSRQPPPTRYETCNPMRRARPTGRLSRGSRRRQPTADDHRMSLGCLPILSSVGPSFTPSRAHSRFAATLSESRLPHTSQFHEV